MKDRKVNKIIDEVAEIYKEALLHDLSESESKEAMITAIKNCTEKCVQMFGGYKLTDKIDFMADGMRIKPANIETALLMAGVHPDYIDSAKKKEDALIIDDVKYKYDIETATLSLEPPVKLNSIDVTFTVQEG